MFCSILSSSLQFSHKFDFAPINVTSCTFFVLLHSSHLVLLHETLMIISRAINGNNNALFTFPPNCLNKTNLDVE